MIAVLPTRDLSWSLMDPWFLAIVPLVLLLFVWRLLRARAALPSANSSLLAGLPKTLRARFCLLPLILQALAMIAFAIALARPVTRDVLPIREKGIDIVLVLDISSSMLAADMSAEQELTRMAAAREKALEFAMERVTDRVGLLTFARFPELRCPLTLDQEALASFLRTVETVGERSPENKTAIGVALAKAVNLLEDSVAKSKVVVLLSDGENNVPDITPGDAARLAKDAGVRVHCIGIGAGQVFNDPFFGRREIKPQFKSLKTIANICEGEFFEAESGVELTRVYDQINGLEKVEMEDPRYRTVDLYRFPFALGALFLALQLLLEFLWIRRVP
ncbi:MAG: VWA domain-containing protein [Planctomycetota bacterium]|nr:VWA domain-containing protein [Planctomycetota bacterium]